MLWFFLLTPVVIFLACIVYFILFMKWHTQQSGGDRFFSRPLVERKAFERSLIKHTYILVPFLRFVSKVAYQKRLPAFRYKGITCPSAISSAGVFAATEKYQATAADIFIATQMKCGTTWMQQIVFEILHHGDGNLNDDGYRHMYALSPWIETSPKASVAIENAPLVSSYKKRIIKTHLPVQLCPYSPDARYIYVTRNPVSCFASCKDFLEFLSGAFCPKINDLADWFCSDDMWWGSWPAHVNGWWEKSRQAENVLFVTFEELKDNTHTVVETISRFLGVSLTADELAKVLEKVSFAYMRDHEEQFEMSPPNIFSVVNSHLTFMQNGNTRRDHAIPPHIKKRIMDYCGQEHDGRAFPFEAFYPEG